MIAAQPEGGRSMRLPSRQERKSSGKSLGKLNERKAEALDLAKLLSEGRNAIARTRRKSTLGQAQSESCYRCRTVNAVQRVCSVLFLVASRNPFRILAVLLAGGFTYLAEALSTNTFKQASAIVGIRVDHIENCGSHFKPLLAIVGAPFRLCYVTYVTCPRPRLPKACSEMDLFLLRICDTLHPVPDLCGRTNILHSIRSAESDTAIWPAVLRVPVRKHRAMNEMSKSGFRRGSPQGS